jgi:cytochrome c-type biogenesis protein
MNMHEPSALLAFGLGLWTAVQPCPMTANVAAVSYLGRRAGTPLSAIGVAVLYAAGQTIAYVSLALLVLEGIASAWRVSAWLQQNVNLVFGPVWILAGMALLGLLPIRLPRPRLDSLSANLTERDKTAVRARAAWCALPFGILLALGFCPVTATIFFVDLLTIALTDGSHVVYPCVYALGAALPVLVFAVLLSAGSSWLGSILNRAQQVQRWLNWSVGGVLLVLGIYDALKFNFEILPF